MSKEKDYGQYFTPLDVAEFMLSLSNAKPAKAKVLEPSCGEGVFLKALKSKDFKHVRAYEIDPTLKIQKQGYNLRIGSFISAKETNNSYDLIIGNPPYVRWKNIPEHIKEELKQYPAWGKDLNSLTDYLCVFILRSVNLLKEGGELIFITPEYWTQTQHAAKMRDFLCEHGDITHVVKLGEAKIFEQATVSTMIFRFIKKNKTPNSSKTTLEPNGSKTTSSPPTTTGPSTSAANLVGQQKLAYYDWAQRTKPTPKDWKKIKAALPKNMIPGPTTNKPWLLADPEHFQEISTLEKACDKRMIDAVDIANGMVSGMDKAFKVTELAEGKKLNTAEKAALIKVQKSYSLDRFTPQLKEDYYFLLKPGSQPASEQAFRKQYPTIHQHLQPHKTQLLQRYDYDKTLKYWQWAFPRSQHVFQNKSAKIFVPCKERITNKDYLRFDLVPAGIYALQDVTALIPFKETKEDIHYLLAYLNHPTVMHWFKYCSINRGGVLEFSEGPLASLPFMSINFENKKEVELYKKIVQNTKDILKELRSTKAPEERSGNKKAQRLILTSEQLINKLIKVRS